MGNETSKKVRLNNDDDVSKKKRFSLSSNNSQGWLSTILLEI